MTETVEQIEQAEEELALSAERHAEAEAMALEADRALTDTLAKSVTGDADAAQVDSAQTFAQKAGQALRGWGSKLDSAVKTPQSAFLALFGESFCIATCRFVEPGPFEEANFTAQNHAQGFYGGIKLGTLGLKLAELRDTAERERQEAEWNRLDALASHAVDLAEAIVKARNETGARLGELWQIYRVDLQGLHPGAERVKTAMRPIYEYDANAVHDEGREFFSGEALVIRPTQPLKKGEDR